MTESLTIESLKSRLAVFRKNRPTKKSRIPEDIWLDACILCEHASPSYVSKTLGLCTGDLRKRLRILSGEPSTVRKKTSKTGSFVDLGSVGDAIGRSISLEIETSNGIKIRIQCLKADLSFVIQNLARTAA